MPFLIAFLLVPVLEIWLMIHVGGVLGAWPTVGPVVAAAVAGAVLLRIQGFTVLQRARVALAAGEFPASSLFDGLFVLLAGLLLILPGFLTDILGLLLFIPPLRHRLGAALWNWISHRPDITIFRDHRVVEGEYHVVRTGEPPAGPALPPSDPDPRDRR